MISFNFKVVTFFIVLMLALIINHSAEAFRNPVELVDAGKGLEKAAEGVHTTYDAGEKASLSTDESGKRVKRLLGGWKVETAKLIGDKSRVCSLCIDNPHLQGCADCTANKVAWAKRTHKVNN